MGFVLKRLRSRDMASFAYPYLVFVINEASLLVKKANEILEMNVGGSKLPFSKAPFFNFPYTPVHVTCVHGCNCSRT